MNDQPLVDFVDKILTDAGSIKRKIVVGTVDVNTGNYVTFDERSAPIDQMARRVVSSASIPFVFPHQLIDNMTLMDGGTVWNINMVSAIERCREQVDDDSQITVDVISCARDFKSNNSFSANSIGNWLKYRAIKSFNSGMRNVYETQLAYPKVNYRYFFQASEPLTSGFEELAFGPEILGPMIELGKKDAATVVGLGEGALFEKVNTWVQKKNKNEQVPSLEAFLYE